MKKTYFLLILVFTSCSSLKYLNSFDGFKNNPKEVETIKYEVNYQDNIGKEEIAYRDIYYYDSEGRKLKSITYRSDGSLSSNGWYYFYNKNGNRIKSILYNLDSSINVQNDYKYNKYGQLIERTYISGGKKSITTHVFNKGERRCYITGKKSDGSFKENAVFKYDKKWNEMELLSYDKNGNQKSRIEFLYDKAGNKIRSKWYDAKNNLYNISKTVFNEKNDPIWAGGTTIKGHDTIIRKGVKFKYQYDKFNNIIEEKFFSKNGELSWITRNNFKY